MRGFVIFDFGMEKVTNIRLVVNLFGYIFQCRTNFDKRTRRQKLAVIIYEFSPSAQQLTKQCVSSSGANNGGRHRNLRGSITNRAHTDFSGCTPTERTISAFRLLNMIGAGTFIQSNSFVSYGR